MFRRNVFLTPSDFLLIFYSDQNHLSTQKQRTYELCERYAIIRRAVFQLCMNGNVNPSEMLQKPSTFDIFQYRNKNKEQIK